MGMSSNSIDSFIEELSSKAAVPGGGGACGLVAAVGMSLGNMVMALTNGKKKYAKYQEEVEETIKRASILTKDLLECMDKDAKAFEPLSKAYALPKETREEIEYRDKVMEEALLVAAKAPLEMMELILDAMKMIDRIAQIGSRLALSDAGVGISMCNSAMEGASLNVYINTKLMKNTKEAKALELRADELREQASEIATKTFDYVLKEIRG
ncbi:cyclodeaminase/cyclohydrolase family protein [Lachnospira multipara]|uniref:cyclodeaminase/cyclohydrolase family protein n=1 Tax=Lachnospira multipara TaxID=28051 RepID=UPI00054CDEFE|nr:cyclodeaminase/cyclohydrolase family protein [Lachnospira multipara]